MTMSHAMFDIYDGDKPYLFVSYSHADEKLVFPLLKGIQEAGFRLWMDRGIEVGTEWSNNIAERLSRCEAVLFFVSKNSIGSENCLDEIACAKSHKKTAILIFLEEDVVLPGGVEMQTARFQRLYATRHDNMNSFISALASSPTLQPCREVPMAPVAEPIPAPQPVPQPTAQPVVYCPRCSAALPAGSGFCGQCGASLQAPVYAPQPPYAPPAQPKKKLSKRAWIVLIAVLAVLVATIVVNVFIAIDENRQYTADEVASAFEDAGYSLTIDPDGYDFAADSDAEFVLSTTAYLGARNLNGCTDEIYVIYAVCTDASTARLLYDAMGSEFGAEGEEVFGEDWYRSAFYDRDLGECVYVSMHGDAVLLTGVDYFDYTLEEGVYYDYEPESVLNKVNF